VRSSTGSNGKAASRYDDGIALGGYGQKAAYKSFAKTNKGKELPIFFKVLFDHAIGKFLFGLGPRHQRHVH
jgi:hypothetical protein